MLKFSKVKGNAKLRWLGKGAYTWSTLAGHQCIGADKCLSKAVETPEGIRIQDGKRTEFRCYSASQEIIYPSLYKQRKHNMDMITQNSTSLDNLVNLIESSLPKDLKVLRLFVSGDFPTQRVFDAWLQVARNHPEIHFYTYTKSVVFWVKRIGQIPENFLLTASYGGKWDSLIDQYKLRYCKVVMDETEAKALKLPIDTTDKYSMMPRFRNTNFCLVVHGPGPKGSKHALAWDKQIRGKRKFHGYNKETAMKT